MRIDGIELREGSQITNLTVASGSSFPSSPNTGEMFYLTSNNTSIQGLYVYISGWTRISTETQLVAPNGTVFPATPVEAQLFYLNSNDSSEGLYYYDTTNGWSIVSAPTGAAAQIPVAGDVSGTLTPGTSSILTLANVVTAGTYKSVTVNAKGQVTAGTNPTTLAGYGITDAQPLSSELTQLGGLSGTGIPVRTAPATWTTTAIAGTSGRVTVTNGSGVSGAPTIDLATVTQTGTATFVKVATDGYGRVTNTSAVAASDISSLVDSRYLNQTNQTITLSGDVTGSGTAAITTTLATVNSAPGSKGSASSVPVFNVNAKGLVTAEVDTPIAIDASQTTTGSFLNARISQTSVTQYQGNLVITEPQITNGSLLARNADNEIISGTWTFNSPISGATPVAGGDLTTKNYVDSAIAGLTWKNSVKAASTTNMTLSGTQTVDGIALVAGDRVLVKNQTNTPDNGIYVVSSGSWTRATDSTSASQLDGEAVYVLQGTTQADTGWTETATITTVGADAIIYSQFSGSGSYVAGTGLALNGNTFSNTGVTSVVSANSNITLSSATGAVTITLPTTLTGLTSVTSTNFVGTLTGSVTGASTLNVLKAGDTMSGDLKISKGTPQLILNSAASGQGRYVTYQTAGVTRWVMGADSSTESGSAAGSNLFIQRYDDTGAVVDVPFQIYRSTGLTSILNLSAAGSLTGAASLNVLKTGDTMTGNLLLSSASIGIGTLTPGATSSLTTLSSFNKAEIYSASGNVGFGVIADAANTVNTFTSFSSTLTQGNLFRSFRGTGSAVAPAAGTAGMMVYTAQGGALTSATNLVVTTSTSSYVDTVTGAGDASGYLTFSTRPDGSSAALTERLRIDKNGNLLKGYTTPLVVGGAGIGNQFVDSGGGSNMALVRYTTTAISSPNFNMARSRSATFGAYTAVVQDDKLGQIGFAGDDGTALTAGAQIWGAVDGAVTTGAVPTRLVFATSNTSGVISEVVRMTSAGKVGIGTIAPSYAVEIAANNSTMGGHLQLTDTGDVKSWRLMVGTYPSGSSNPVGTFAIYESGIGSRFSIAPGGAIGVGAPGNYGVAGQVLSSNGASSPPAWVNNGLIGAYAENTSWSFGITTATATPLDTFSTTAVRSAKYIAQITDTTNSAYECLEFMLIHDGTTAYITTYADIFTGSASLGGFDANISSGVLTLNYTASAATTKVVKLVRTAIAI